MRTRRLLDRYPEVERWTEEVTVIGAGVVFEGEVSSRGSLIVAGRVVGPVRSDALVRIALGGVVQGPVRARAVLVEGAVDGDIEALDQFELRMSGRVRGDVRGPSVAVAEGAYLKGAIQARPGGVRQFRERRR